MGRVFTYEAPPGTIGSEDPLITAARSGSDIQEVSVTDLLSEGPIEGLVKGEASVYLEGDQLSDTGRVLRESRVAEPTSDPHTITFAAASSFNQPVTASMKDRAGNTAYFNDLSETFTNEYRYRWLTVHKTSSSKIKIEQIDINRNVPTGIDQIGRIRICAVGSSSPFSETTFFAQSFKTSQRGQIFFNLKPIIKVTLPSGISLRGDLVSTHDTSYGSELNSGSTKRAIFQPYNSGPPVNNSDIFAAGSNEVYGEVSIDRVLQVEIQTVANNNVIYIPKNSDALAVTDKEFTLSGEVVIKGGVDSGGTVSGAQKYPGSSLEFRVGNRVQEPFYQFSGTGAASFPVALTGNQGDTFDNTNTYPTTIASGYPDVDPLPSGMVQKVIVFSSSFTSAQINEIDRVKIQFEFPQGHYAMSEEGDDLSSGAAFNIELQGSETGGANATDWQDLTGQTFKYVKWFGVQKTAITYTLEIPVNTFLNIQDLRLQITRLTPDGQSNTNNHTGKTNAQGYIVRDRTSEVSVVVDTVRIAQIIATIEEKLSHPFSAMAAVRFTSKSFSSPPRRAYLARGLRVKIPSNYTPRHLSSTGVATYTGIWNGEFSDEGTTNSSGLDISTHYTDNPAWVFYDMLVNNRYGLGDYLEQTDINKFQLYKIAKYCDELVPTKDGGTEPRFTANLYLTKATEAYKVLKDMATIFRGLLYWTDGTMNTIQDAPATPIYNFSSSNILEGTLSTQTTGSKARANQYTVVWNNPSSAYKQEPIVIEDRENIVETGKIIRANAVAFGCTSEGQAIRYGRWKAWTAVNQTELLTFTTSVNAAFLSPGDVVNVQDSSKTGVHFSGRITASSNSAITLDRNIASLSSQAQIDGGNAETFTFQSGADYSYTLSLLVTKRSVVLAQDTPAVITHGGTTYTYNRGDEVVFAKTGGTSAQLIGGSDSDEQVRKNITNIQDNAGNDILVEFRNSTSVETKSFTSSDVSIVNGVTQIAISGAFSGTIPSSTIWTIKEIYKGVNTNPSYKEYKILGIKETNEGNYELSGVEFYNNKFDEVDRDIVISQQDPVNRPEPNFIPQPEAVYVFETPRYKQQLQELQVMWETPLNSDGTEFEHTSAFALHIEPKLPDGTDLIEIENASRRLERFNGVPDGVYNFGVQTLTKEGKRSEIKWQVIEVQDKFKVPCARTTEGVPLGIRSNSKMSSDTSTWSMTKIDWAMQSPGAPGTQVNNANQGTAATYQQSLSALGDGNSAFIYFDADDTTDYFKLVVNAAADFQNTSQAYWRDLTQYTANTENDWTDTTNNADARVTVAPRTNKVVKSEGTTAFLTRFQIGDILRIKYASGKFVGGKVAFIESDDVLYVDRRLNDTDSTITSVDEAKAIARNTLRTDPENDAVIARVFRNGSNYTHTPIDWVEDLSLTGLRALIVDTNISALNYNSSGTQQNNAAITITADATAYSSPEFQVTGAGFSGVSTSADGGFSTTGVSGQTLTKQIHNGSTPIAMGDKSPLTFTVSVRESADQSNAKSKTFNIIKVQDGSIGADGKTVTLDSDDYSIIYDEEGENPSYTSSGSSNIVVTATARNFTDPLYRFTFDGGSAGAWTDTSGTSAATFTYASGSIPTTYNKANWPKVLLVEVGEKPGSYSSGDAPASIEATDSISFIGVKTGSGGVSLVNSNHAHTYTTDVNGTATGISITGTTLELIVGGVVYTYIGKTDGTYGIAGGQTHDNKEWYVESAAVVGNDLTIGGPTANNSNVVTIGNHTGQAGTDDSEVITYTCKYKQSGTIKTITTTQTVTKSKQGAQGVQGNPGAQGNPGQDGDPGAQGGPGFFFLKRTGTSTSTGTPGSGLGAPSSSEIASPAAGNLAIVENSASPPNQAAWRYVSSSWNQVSDFFRAEVIAANAIGASQLAISNADASSAGIFADLGPGGVKPRIRIFESGGSERVRLGYLPDS